METRGVSAVMPKSKKDARYVDCVTNGKEKIDEDSTKSCWRMSEELNTSI